MCSFINLTFCNMLSSVASLLAVVDISCIFSLCLKIWERINKITLMDIFVKKKWLLTQLRKDQLNVSVGEANHLFAYGPHCEKTCFDACEQQRSWPAMSEERACPKVIKLFPCSTQLSAVYALCEGTAAHRHYNRKMYSAEHEIYPAHKC